MAIRASFQRLVPLGLSYLGSGGSLITSSVAQLITFAILARCLGTQQFALYVTITAFTNVAVQICGLGTQETLVRRVAQNPADQPRMMGHALLLTGGSFIVLLVLGLVALPYIVPTAESRLETLGSLALLLLSNVLILRFISLATASYLARSQFVIANALEIAFGFTRTLAAVLGCLVFGVTSVAAWSVWFFGAHLLIALVSVWLIWRLGAPRYGIVREEIRIGALFSTQFVFKAVRQNTDLLVLGMFTSAEIVGSYGVARRVLDSSYLSVEALNRLIYPGTAIALLGGFHNAYDRVRRVFIAAMVISTAAAVAVFILAPLMPILFGHTYPSMVGFTQILCWVVIPMAAGSVALEAFGAAGRQDVRAIITNSSNILAAGLVALTIFALGISGAFAASYTVEILTAITAWLVFLRFVNSDRLREARPLAAE